MDIFVAIDFETLYPQHESACAVGMVKYSGGVILGQFFSLIRPPDEAWQGRCNSDIHGIDPAMLEFAPSFDLIFPQIEAFVGDAVPVAHHASVERACFEKCCQYYGLQTPVWVGFFEDTYAMCGKKLVDACKEAGIDTNRHHDPLQDAMMCAQLHMVLLGSQPIIPSPSETARVRRHWSHDVPKCLREDLTPLPESEVLCKNTPFFQRHVLYTGSFALFPNRCDIGHQLKLFGAIVEREWTARTEVLLVGRDPGPKKLAKAAAKGIPIVAEDEFYHYLDFPQ